jgi:acetyl-CoA carboxylase carboxyltransferase component
MNARSNTPEVKLDAAAVGRGGVLDPRARIEQVCDPGSVQPLRTAARSRRMGAGALAGDGVLAASGAVNGRPVFCYAQDAKFAGGSLGEAHADTIVRVLSLAARAEVPVIALVESAGARIQEAMAALSGYARIFRRTVELSARVPQISVVSGVAAGGGAYAPALTDFVVMVRSASMFLTGPAVVRQAIGEDVTMSGLGGADVHARNGVCQLVARDEAEAASLARTLLSYLPQSVFEDPPRAAAQAPLARALAQSVPQDTRKVYDVRDVACGLVDRGELLELSPRWARNMVTAFARIDGRAIGIVANQPLYRGGALDVDASQKAATFVRTCDTFGLPLVVLVDTPGFLPGRAQERRGIIREGADLLRAFAAASVPRLTVILRHAYGGAYITMNSRDLGADHVFAWPQVRIGIMSPLQAVGIAERHEIARSAHPTARVHALAERYATEHQDVHVVAGEGFVDEVIAPAETRERLSWALATISRRRRPRSANGHPGGR